MMDFKTALGKAIDTAEKRGTIKAKRADLARRRLEEKGVKDIKALEGRFGKFTGAEGKVGAIDWAKFLPILIQMLPFILALFGL